MLCFFVRHSWQCSPIPPPHTHTVEGNPENSPVSSSPLSVTHFYTLSIHFCSAEKKKGIERKKGEGATWNNTIVTNINAPGLRSLTLPAIMDEYRCKWPHLAHEEVQCLFSGMSVQPGIELPLDKAGGYYSGDYLHGFPFWPYDCGSVKHAGLIEWPEATGQTWPQRWQWPQTNRVLFSLTVRPWFYGLGRLLPFSLCTDAAPSVGFLVFINWLSGKAAESLPDKQNRCSSKQKQKSNKHYCLRKLLIMYDLVYLYALWWLTWRIEILAYCFLSFFCCA